MDDGPEQGGQDDYETRRRGASRASRETESRERVFPRLLPKRLARNVEASSSVSWQSGLSPG
jgi:hypothetical protein